MGILIIVGWLLLAVGICFIGLCFNKNVLLGVGAVMVLMASLINSIAW